MNLQDLQQAAEDLRQRIISTCLANGGHLGASLGAVDIAVALHAVFDSPREALIWDVGHQAYAHKLLTGRGERFATLRKFGGISGFLSREESEHDIFGAGHSSTALSAALAIAWSKGRKRTDSGPDWTVAIVGDGGLTAGLAFEALNNIRALPLGPLLIVVNDNQMSISPNIGAVPAILSGGKAREFFSLLGCEYFGPMDGHDLNQLVGTLRGIRERPWQGHPIVLHALTQKGKGYAPAEENPGSYHGVSGVSAVAAPPSRAKTFSEALGEAMVRIAQERPELVAITAAMPEGTGLLGFASRHPDRFFDVGIAEPHAVTFAAGLATQGLRPVVAVYSTFLQRGFDELIHDVALQKLSVIFAIDRAGLVGADGATHHGAFDIAYLGMIPGMTLFAPETLDDVEACMRLALSLDGPAAIRYPRGTGAETGGPLSSGLRWHRRVSDPDLIVVSAGTAARKVDAALRKLDPTQASKAATKTTWISAIQLKPLPAELENYLASHPRAALLSVEEGVIHGGFGQQLASFRGPRAATIGYPDRFIGHGSIGELERAEGIAQDDVAREIGRLLAEARPASA